MENFFHWLIELDFAVLVWLLPTAVTIHMIEEMIWLPEWSKTAGSWHVPVRPGQFALASLILLGVVFGVTAAASRMMFGGTAVYVAAGLALTFLLNIYFPHVGSLLALKRYPPGLVTGLLINLPLMPFLIWQAVSDGYMDSFIFLLLALPLAGAAAVGWSALLYVGSILLK